MDFVTWCKLKAQTKRKYKTIQNHDKLLRKLRQLDNKLSISSGSKAKYSKACESSVNRGKKVHNHDMIIDTYETEKDCQNFRENWIPRRVK